MNKQEIIKKLRSMSEGGTIHEREVAERKIKEICEKYGLQEESEIEYFGIKYKKDTKKLLVQLIACFFDNRKVETFGHKKVRNVIYIQISKIEALALKTYIDHYILHHNRQLKSFVEKQKKTFTLAFISKNNLYPSNTEENTELTQEILEMWKLEKEINPTPYLKPLCNEKLFLPLDTL